MPRHARLDAPGTIHHVIGRGIAGIKVFPTKKDRSDFLLRVAERCEAGALMVYGDAYGTLVQSELIVLTYQFVQTA
jgi:hypothetical protein